MSKALLAVFLLFFSFAPLSAQTQLDVGTAVGSQSYRSSIDDPRVLTGLEALWRRHAVGVHLATEYADLSEEGALIAVHVDPVYRLQLGRDYSMLLGAGPTFISLGSGNLTWNAELEIARHAGRTSIFGRVRHYDFTLDRFREGEAGPSGPAVSLGVRFATVN